MVLDPSEERIKSEFTGVKRTFLPLHSVLRIDEVKKQGVSKITALEGGANVAQFPMPMYSPPPGDEEVGWQRCSTLPGAPALSGFRIEKLLARIAAAGAGRDRPGRALRAFRRPGATAQRRPSSASCSSC